MKVSLEPKRDFKISRTCTGHKWIVNNNSLTFQGKFELYVAIKRL